MRTLRTGAVILLLIAVLTGCGSSGVPPTTVPTVPLAMGTPGPLQTRVEMLLGNGKTDPTWSLPADTADNLRQMLVTDQRVEPVDMELGKGYQGFRVYFAEPGGSEATTFLVHQGVIQVHTPYTDAYFEDSKRSMEKLLLDSAQGHVDAETLTQARKRAGL